MRVNERGDGKQRVGILIFPCLPRFCADETQSIPASHVISTCQGRDGVGPMTLRYRG